jgi:hypothetical protein
MKKQIGPRVGFTRGPFVVRWSSNRQYSVLPLMFELFEEGATNHLAAQ